MTATIWAAFTIAGFHHWPGASERRAYLAQSHRHLFAVKVWAEVTEDDRQVEFHDLGLAAESAARHLGYGYVSGIQDFGPQSCEMLARRLLDALRSHAWPVHRVEWSEDGEYGAIVEVDE